MTFDEQIEYSFQNPANREIALTHSSFTNEVQLPLTECNERCEFLGDAVLEMVSTVYIFEKYPELLEGDMTKLRASIVCEPTLAKVARRLSLGSYLKLGKGEEQLGGAERDSTLADLFEAVIGAIYLDGGYAPAEQFVLRNLESEIEFMRHRFMLADSKTRLQEILQKKGKKEIEYSVISEKGPEHDKIFTVEVYCGSRPLGRGSGKNKKEAEQNAATEALNSLR
ncbi:MAG: ribonuclease III [Clostridiales bacterium]|jgi:ribonuclease-3|nr:ribonuclease III [Clostridiales bacterium]